MKKILAVSNNDLDRLLTDLNLSQALEQGLLCCQFCKEKLSRESIGCIYPLGTEIRLCCKTLDCLRKALEETNPLRGLPNGSDERNES